MKNKLLFLATLFVSFLWALGAASADTIIVNGTTVYNGDPVTENGRILAPLVPFCQALGVQAQWNQELQNIKIEGKDTEIFLYVNGDQAFVNRVATPIAVPPRIVNDQIYIPVVFVSTTLGFQVSWDADKQTVYVAGRTNDLGSPPDSSTNVTRLLLSDGSVYEGKVSEGQPNGKGVRTGPDGSSFSGDFRNGRPDGVGEYHYPSGAVYNGQFSNGQMNGWGILNYVNGNKYEGNWLNSQFNGYGEFSFTDGTIYRGNFLNGLSEGTGSVTYPNGRILNGTWQQGKLMEGR
ncbi:MAG TPA: stalk domain-containing protein [Syntrophomonadaceae bacterium]|nr:stalk domain-containing protein [Syntrophomonadaceae bacterium]